MYTGDIYRKLSRRCRGMFLGVFPCDMLPRHLPRRRPLMMICNTDPSHKSGEHWIAIYFGVDGHAEYFDSFGREPETVFLRFINRHSRSFVFNREQLQSVISRFCGHYCVFYCLFKRLDYSMNSIVNCFSNDTALNDTIVHNFVCENL